MRVGDATVEYSPNFRLYLTTRLSNPQFPPEAWVMVQLINFSVSTKGLEDQLLADVVRREQPDLENTRDQLVLSISNDKHQLQVAPAPERVRQSLMWSPELDARAYMDFRRLGLIYEGGKSEVALAPLSHTSTASKDCFPGTPVTTPCLFPARDFSTTPLDGPRVCG